jgi:tetratricopeptide (TPR) repeat protein
VLIEPKRPEVFSYRSILLFQMNNKEQAWRDCNKCLELDSSFVDCYITHGTIAHSRNDYQQSIKDFSRAIELQPSNAVAYKNRGQIYMQLNEKEKGCNDFQKAADLGNQEAFQLMQTYCR